MACRLRLTLARLQDFTEETLLEEIRALLELARVEYKLQHSGSGIVDIILDSDQDVHRALKYLCRSAVIKKVETEDNSGFSTEFGREFTCKPRPLERVDTASAPLEPLVSRLLVNLARVDEGYHVLDPFSGVGGILFEAALVGAHVVGIDIGFKYVKTMLRNLVYMGDGICSDTSASIPLKTHSVDAIVSDPPYSKLSVVDKDIDYIYYCAIRECSRVIKPGRYLAWTCIACMDVETMLEENEFEVVHLGYQSVHRSMLRKVVVARRL